MLNDFFFTKLLSILTRHIEERCGCPVIITKPADLTIIFELDPKLGYDGYSIAIQEFMKIHIIGQNNRGVLYGLGKFLHTSQFAPNKFLPSKWQGTSIPDCSFRAIYFATHFFNFYHAAPLVRIQAYMEDLALWGVNMFLVWYDMHHFNGIKDPRAQAFLDRLNAILQSAKNLELQTGIGIIGNEGYANSPRELRANQTFPGTRHIRGGYGVEICPSKPGGVNLLMQCFSEEFEAFKAINPDFLMVWPYDQGGCCCSECRPWGANGFLRLIPQITTLARRFFPNIKIILSTWLFDPNGIIEGEWEGLTQKLADHPNWVDFILADSHTTFPEYPLKHGSPGKFPLINFPEISMWNMSPWGGYGANPLPHRFQGFWNTIKDHISGGIPYSEGIFEDLNKVIWEQFYWSKPRPVEEIVKEYCQYEISGCNLIRLVEAITILEQNHVAFKLRKVPKNRYNDAGALKAFQIFNEINDQLPKHLRESWRWQILYLRALIDYERFQGKRFPTPKVQAAFEKLREIYFAQNGECSVRPPIIRFSWFQKLFFGTPKV